jgi:hypothetical protein
LPKVSGSSQEFFLSPPHAAIVVRRPTNMARNVPSDRLLEFRVTEGWRPLCEFLNVEIPDTSFPHLNEREGMLELLQMVLWTNESFAY